MKTQVADEIIAFLQNKGIAEPHTVSLLRGCIENHEVQFELLDYGPDSKMPRYSWRLVEDGEKPITGSPAHSVEEAFVHMMTTRSIQEHSQ